MGDDLRGNRISKRAGQEIFDDRMLTIGRLRRAYPRFTKAAAPVSHLLRISATEAVSPVLISAASAPRFPLAQKKPAALPWRP